MTPAQYTQEYAGMWSWIIDDDETYSGTPIINYLQNNKQSSATKAQSVRADEAYAALTRAIQAEIGGGLGSVFKVGDETYMTLSLQRVFWGKGAPNEIQDVLWLATWLDVPGLADVKRYCNERLGVDCGGFVANYWGFGRPTLKDPKPDGSAGMLPRTFWGEAGTRRRARPDQIQPGDAVIFFEGKVFNNDPSTLAPQRSDGSYDTAKGTKAFHIGLVESMSASGNDVRALRVAESSGARSIYAGSGVNVRDVAIKSTTVGGGLVGCALSDSERIYFVGPRNGRANPYLSQY